MARAFPCFIMHKLETCILTTYVELCLKLLAHCETRKGPVQVASSWPARLALYHRGTRERFAFADGRRQSPSGFARRSDFPPRSQSGNLSFANKPHEAEPAQQRCLSPPPHRRGRKSTTMPQPPGSLGSHPPAVLMHPHFVPRSSKARTSAWRFEP